MVKICIDKSCTDINVGLVLIIMLLAYVYYTYQPLPTPQKINIKLLQNESNKSNKTDNLFHQRINDPLLPPERTYLSKKIPINIKSRGTEPPYQQVGFVFQNDIRLPLYGRQQYRGSTKYDYYVRDDSRHLLKIELELPGDKELYDDDIINIDGYDGDFLVKIYEIDTPNYIPYAY